MHYMKTEQKQCTGYLAGKARSPKIVHTETLRMKTCTGCGESKRRTKEFFRKREGEKHKYYARCRDCQSEYNRNRDPDRKKYNKDGSRSKPRGKAPDKPPSTKEAYSRCCGVLMPSNSMGWEGVKACPNCRNSVHDPIWK